MSYLIKDKKVLEVIPEGFQITETITPGNWIVKLDKKYHYYYLQKTDDFKLPEKIYGNVERDAKKYLKVFKSNDKNLGVLLRGFKGTGKSLTAKKLCKLAKLPVIIIAEPFCDAAFITFLDQIKEECIIFLDEFEKLYRFNHESGNDTQESFLSIMDGAIQGSKKLFMLTANDGNIHSALLNRPGRIRYEVYYDGLSNEVIESVLKDKLQDKSKKEDVKNIFENLGRVNMDSVMSMIEEVNNFPEDNVIDLANGMNLSPEDRNFLLSWTESNTVSMGAKASGKENKLVIMSNPLTVDHIYLSGDTLFKGEHSIDMRNAEFLEVKRVIKVRYRGIILTFTPIETYKFKFKEISPKN